MFDDFTFELREAEPQQPFTMAEIANLLHAAEKAKRRIICHPDAHERIDALVRNEGYGASLKVIPCAWLEPGQALMMQSEADEEAELREVLDRMAAEQVEKARREYGTWLENERRKAEMLAYLTPGYLINRPPLWPVVLTGL